MHLHALSRSFLAYMHTFTFLYKYLGAPWLQSRWTTPVTEPLIQFLFSCLSSLFLPCLYSLSLLVFSLVRDMHEVMPHERYYGKKPNLSHTRIFGAITYVHILDEKRQKLDPKSEKCILVGYSVEQKGYKCYNPSTRKVRVTQDVVFDKYASWYAPEKILTSIAIDMESAEQELDNGGSKIARLRQG